MILLIFLVTEETLYKGSYYIYTSGLNLDIAAPFKVAGGLQISIRNKEILTKYIAITE